MKEENLYQIREKILKKGCKFKNTSVRNGILRESTLYLGRTYTSYLRVKKMNVSHRTGKEALYEWLNLDPLTRETKEIANRMKEEELLFAVLNQIECNEFNEPKQFELFESIEIIKNYENYKRTME